MTQTPPRAPNIPYLDYLRDRKDGEGSFSLPENIRYIAVEGAIGAGKSTLASYLAQHFNGQIILEDMDSNPFLGDFYQDRDRWAFHTQLSFLASRFKRQRTLLARDLFQHTVFTDYTFDRDRIFAHLNLSGDELQLYESLYSMMEPVAPNPDLVIYLQSTPQRLIENIRKRNRSLEHRIEKGYIKALAEAYDYHFFRYKKSPLLIVNASRIDFVKYPDDFRELVRQIKTIRHLGITYVNPVPSTESQQGTLEF